MFDIDISNNKIEEFLHNNKPNMYIGTYNDNELRIIKTNYGTIEVHDNQGRIYASWLNEEELKNLLNKFGSLKEVIEYGWKDV